MPLVSLHIIRYKKRFIPFALLAMAVHHIPLWLNRQIRFYKLMGSGRNGTFDKVPDWQQWALLTVSDEAKPAKPVYGSFIAGWYRFFGCEIYTLLLQPIEGHGRWDGKEVFGALPRQSGYEGQVAVLTRATIRINKLKFFWQHVAPVAQKMNQAPGFLFSAGIGEIPWIKQATFSVWTSKEAMKGFAYGTKEHGEVIQKTRQQRWYSEDMFTRFIIIETLGTLRGIDPLKS
ncbi:MAG: spheroidene monooxygenase [Ferruginibacter sp.]